MTRRETIFWSVVGATFVIGFLSLIPSHYEICSTDEAKHEHCPLYQVVPFAFIKIAKILDAAGAVIAALATIAIACFTLTLKRATDKLWDTGEKQRDLAENTAERQLRAYVTLEAGHVELVANGTAYIVDVKLKNYGNTPAYHFAAWVEGDVFPVDADPFPAEAPTLGQQVNRSIVGPNSGILLRSPNEPLSATDLAAIRSGTHALFMWGGADYVDAFKRHRHFMFRASMTGQEVRVGTNFSKWPSVNLTGWPLTPHPKGYEGD